MLAAPARIGLQWAVVIGTDMSEPVLAFRADTHVAAHEALLGRDQSAGKAVQGGVLVDIDTAAVRADIGETQMGAAAEITLPLALLEVDVLDELLFFEP